MYDDKSASAEERLWMAVVEKAVLDFRLLLKTARRDYMRYGKPSVYVLWDLKALRYELKQAWFDEIASYAGIHSSQIITFLDKEALAVGIDLNKPVLNPHPIKGIVVIN